MDRRQVIAVADQEAAAMSASDMDQYLAILADDAVFLPPSSPARRGGELRQWLRDFLEGFTTEWLRLVHGETVVAGDLAYHDYAYSMKVTPQAGGQPSVGHGKGLHILRREPDGSWKMVRNVWNAAPAP
jgi:ketosteroid isomerase-like protein